MIVSTSFGLANAFKVYMELDLGGRYKSVHDLQEGREILPLYPQAAEAEQAQVRESRRRAHRA